MGKVGLLFAPGVEVGFADGRRGLEQFEKLAVRGTRFLIVIFGPEGWGLPGDRVELTPLLLNILVDGVVVYDRTGRLGRARSQG
jgi:hypothetical protein